MESNLKRNTYMCVCVYIYIYTHLKLTQSSKWTIKNTVDWAVKQLKFTSHTLEAGKCKIKVLGKIGFFLRPLLLDCRQLPSCCTLWPLLYAGMGKKRKWVLLYFFIQEHKSHHQGPMLMISSNLNYLPKVSSPSIITLKFTYEFWREINIQYPWWLRWQTIHLQ